MYEPADNTNRTRPWGEHGLSLPAEWNEFLTVVGNQFYLGPPGSGTPMHAHRDAFNFLVYGRKRWFVYRPSDARYGSSPTLEWFRAKARVPSRTSDRVDARVAMSGHRSDT